MDEVQNMYKELIDKIDIWTELNTLFPTRNEYGFHKIEFESVDSSQAQQEWKPLKDR